MSAPLLRRYLRAPIVIGALALAMLVGTATADATELSSLCASTSSCTGDVATYVHPYAGFQGWGYVLAPNACPAGAYCLVAASTPAYRWNGRSWSQADMGGNRTNVYVYPFAEGWSWVWTRDTGWLAVADANVFVPSPTRYRL